MNLLGMTIARVKGALVVGRTKSIVNALTVGDVWGRIREPFTGAWQRNLEIDNRACVLAFSAVYSCVAIVSQDIGKLRCKLTEETSDGIWIEITRNSPFLGVLMKPNRYETRIQFFSRWVVSLMLYGNTYVLKDRDNRGVVTDLYVLQPERVMPRIAPDGSIWYTIATDWLAGVETSISVPASEIIHDRINCLFHPLVGVSPIYACGASATQGNRIQNQSAKFFENMSRPSGMLTAPSAIDDETAARLKQQFEQMVGGGNIGRLLVAGSGLKYEPMTMPAVDAQLIEQLKWTVEDVARCFRVPLYMLDAEAIPTRSNVEALQRMYYTQTLQAILEGIEILLDEGLELNKNDPSLPYATEFDLDALLRMDTAARFAAYETGVRGGWIAPNEVRARENLAPVEGGESPYLQQQNFSLAALAKRDASNDPFATTTPGAAPVTLPVPSATPAPVEDPTAEKALTDDEIIQKTTEWIAHVLSEVETA